MTRCPECDRLTRMLVSGQLAAGEWETLRRHAETCEECRHVLDVHQALGDAGQDVVEPSEAEFRQMRRRVFATLDSRARDQAHGSSLDQAHGLSLERGHGLPFGAAHRRSASGWLTSFAAAAGRLLRVHPVPAALALLIVAAGSALIGRWTATPARVDDALLLRTLRHQTASTAGLDAYWDEPFACTNVLARPLPGGRLALSFDVSRHVELVAARESDLARGVLVHAILEPAPTGARLKALGLAAEIEDPRLREAVIFTLARDPTPAVRLKAFEVLTRYPFDPSIRDALLATLQQDPSVQVRLQALEYLAQQQIGPEILRRSIDGGAATDDPVIVQRAIELGRKL